MGEVDLDAIEARAKGQGGLLADQVLALVEAARERDRWKAAAIRERDGSETAQMLDEARSRVDDLTGILDALQSGRCLIATLHRDEGHRESICILAEGHSTAHDDGLGCTWTDGEHHMPTADQREVYRLNRAVGRVGALARYLNTLAEGDKHYAGLIRKALDGDV